MRSIITLLIIFQFCSSFAQLNDVLGDIAKQVSFDKDISHKSSIGLTQSKDIELSVTDEDVLVIKSVTTNLFEGSKETQDIQHLRIPIKYIEDLYVSTTKLGAISCDTCYTDTISSLVIVPLRNEKLFETIDVGNNSEKTNSAIIGISQNQPIGQFEKLCQLIKEEFNISNNESTASCDLDSIQLTSNGEIYTAVKNKNLSTPINLNGGEIKKALKKELIPFLDDMELNAISFTIILNPDNGIETLSIAEYAMTLEPELGFDKLTDEQQKELAFMMGLINKTQNDLIVEKLKSMNWETGICNGKAVTSSFSYEYFKQQSKH